MALHDKPVKYGKKYLVPKHYAVAKARNHSRPQRGKTEYAAKFMTRPVAPAVVIYSTLAVLVWFDILCFWLPAKLPAAEFQTSSVGVILGFQMVNYKS